jgi:iron complex outermembrane receptor protein
VPIGDDQLSVLGEWNWHDRLYFTEFNSNEVSQGPVSTYNAGLRYTRTQGHWWVEAYGKNLSNEVIRSQAWITGAGFGSMVLGQLAPPRTYGVTLHYSFK